MKSLFCIIGPTRSGKTALAVKIAQKLGGVIVSADSRQVYRGLDVGAGKEGESSTIILDGQTFPVRMLDHVPQFGVDVADPRVVFTVADYQKYITPVIHRLLQQKPVIIVGGSGLWVEAALEKRKFQPVLPDVNFRNKLDKLSTDALQKLVADAGIKLNQSDRKNRRRLIRALELAAKDVRPMSLQQGLPATIIGLNPPREELYRRIDERIGHDFTAIIQETKELHAQGVSWKRFEQLGLEYKWATSVLRDRLDRNIAAQKLKFAIHDLARRQLTWFRKMTDIKWVENLEAEQKFVNQIHIR